MLEIRPNCECCDKGLAPDTTEAMICTYECTFCEACVNDILENVCPNCGGGFVPRPIRPKVARRSGLSINHQPPSAERVHTKYSVEELREFSAKAKYIKPEER
ncbi:DUF1272 domain-containing protein [Moritella viscosa]|uniref:Urease n=1 Tax=Moritella viscosa TaxID=80854 RepID=A0A1L0BZB6_9GAMM|nr:DUF1272 domain-containing protein [Moritella viscosa]SGZ12630.1 Putative uncharacterized protein [Moritella viscosa]SHO12950.1 Putative uncharacterized protein [Moritella viscosa]